MNKLKLCSIDVAEFLKALCECWPFEMAVDFLSAKEKKGNDQFFIILN